MNDVIDTKELIKNLQIVKVEGKDVLIDDDVDKAIATIKIYEGKIKKAIDIIRDVAKEALKPYNVKTMRGKYVNITVSSPRKVNEYSVDQDSSSEFWSKQVKLVPNKEAIEKYIEKHGELPMGVHRNELKQSVSIKLKNGVIDDIE